jgi:hypothetical protein
MTSFIIMEIANAQEWHFFRVIHANCFKLASGSLPETG